MQEPTRWRSFEEAREHVHSLGLKSRTEYGAYCNSGEKPVDIPARPEKVYKSEWKGMGDWLGTGTLAPKDKKYLSFEEAREYVHN